MQYLQFDSEKLSLLGLKPYDFFEKIRQLDFVDAAYIYGSRARGSYRANSDIDIALKISDNRPEYKHIVADVIDNADTLLKIDCVNIDEAPENLRKQIIKEAILLFEKNNDEIPF